VQEAVLIAPDATFDDQFGISLAMEGRTVLIGADARHLNTGAAYVFGRSGGQWVGQAELRAPDGVRGDTFGASVDVAGSTAVVGAPGRQSLTGGVYVFVRSGGAWVLESTLTASDQATGDRFGWSVAAWGSRALVGAPYKGCCPGGPNGAAYVFARS
jgi:FG-GAP repeat